MKPEGPFSGVSIVVEDLHKRYGRKPVLRGISFVARSGEITLLVGPNAAGKTTTLGVLAGLVRANRGKAEIHGKSVIEDRITAQRLVSYLPQGVLFHPRLSCRDLLLFYARLRAVTETRVRLILDLMGLAEYGRTPSGELSGGLRQRLGLGVLLLPDAPVLLLDEPGLSLDHDWRVRMQSILQEEAQRGKTVLVSAAAPPAYRISH